MKVFVAKANPITNDEPVDDCIIYIQEELPNLYEYEDMDEYYRKDALKISKALTNHLPRGTRHQLLIALLKDTSCLYEGV